jgi:pilus assembly protein Flp/PilA
MKALKEMFIKMHSTLGNEKGATMVEYALMVALIAGVAITAVALVGTDVTAAFNAIAAKL